MQKAKTAIAHNKPTLGIAEQAAADRVIRSGWLAQHTEVEKFEDEFGKYIGLSGKHAVALSSGSAAIYFALRVLGGPKTVVALPAYACSALRNAVALAGMKAFFLDNEKDSSNVDLSQVNNRRAGLFLIVHTYGIPVDFAGGVNLPVIEDCAQSLGAVINKNKVGTIGDAGIFSFYATKLITAGGQGGMFVSKDRKLADEVRDLRGFDIRNDKVLRFNFKMTDLQGAIGSVQLSRLKGFLARREEIFQVYKSKGVELIDCKTAGISPVRYRAVMRTKHPRKIIEKLRKAGINAIIPFTSDELGGNRKAFPNANEFCNTTVSLPIYPSLKNSEVSRVVSALL